MPAVSKKQQRFFGMVRAAQKGEMENPSPEISKVAATTSMSSVKKFAKTKHKGLPEKKVASEGVVDAIKKIKLNKTKVKKSPYSGRDAGAIAAKVMRQKQHNKYVNFLPMDEALDQKDKPFVKNLVKKLRGGSKTHAKQADDLEKAMNEGSLHKWFKGSKSKDGKPGWVNVKTGGTCASDEPGEGTPKCVSSSKRASMTKAERESASRRKKAADPGQQSKSGAAKPTYVSTDSPRKKKMKEEINLTEVKDKKGKGSGSKDACYHKVKSRYSVWPSAYASGALVKCRKVGAANWGNKSEEVEINVDEAMSSYDRNRKAAAKRAAQRNAERRAGTRGGRMERETYRSEAGVQMHHKGYRANANEAVEYTGPKKGELKGYGSKAFKEYEKNMDPKKRQALKDKATKGMKFTHEGTSYGLYKGSGKASGAMKDFLDKKAKMLTKKRNKQSDAAKNNPHFDSTHPSPSGRNKYEQVTFQQFQEKCWPGYEKKGMKTMFGKRYPNCVKKKK